MSYQVYITRADFWAENEGSEISAGEWLALLGEDAEITLDEVNGPYFAILGSSQKNGKSWLDWSEGNLYTAYANRAMQKKMLQIAGQLRAVVQGEDGEIYTSVEDFPESTGRQQTTAPTNEGLPAYKRREIVWQIIVYGIIVAAIIAINVFDLW